MNHASQVQPIATERAALGLYNPAISEFNIAHWKINGYGASIIIWTSEEWETLLDQPRDAQYYPCGVWCALRMQ